LDAALLALVLSTLRLATPLCLAAMGELVAERAGVLNIGIEGMMLAGAYAAFVAALVSGSATVGCSAGAAAGVALACVFAFFVVERRADPIVCGAALNILALGITGTLSRRFEILSFETPRVPDLLPGLNLFLLGSLLLIPSVALVLYRTRLGLHLRACGERAEAAHVQGIRVRRVRWGATLFGGACAGLAGASLVLWISDVFVEGMTSGRGFIALALVLFGAYRVWRIAFGALLFGFASAFQFRLQASGFPLSHDLLLMLPYLLTLLVLAFSSGRGTAPADLARPFVARD